MSTDTSPVIKRFALKPIYFSGNSHPLNEVIYEYQALQQMMQPIATFLLHFFVNVVFWNFNTIKSTQSIRFISHLVSQKGNFGVWIPIKP